MSEFTKADIKKMKAVIKNESKAKKKRRKKRMNTSKLGFLFLSIWAMAIQTYVMIMIVKLHDTNSLAIITGVVFGEVIAFYLGYLKYSRDINLMHMEKNYIPNYDDQEDDY